MNKPILVIMAAGIGSRYGGLKQLEPVGPSGEIIMEYSIYDALKAGFKKVVFIIQEGMEKSFRERISSKIENIVDTAFVFQRVEDVPSGCKVPEGRTKPWGTGQAVLSCHHVVDTPFAVINADDFYGASSFQRIAKYLQNLKDEKDHCQYCMVGFILGNTLTEHGHVARGVCKMDTEDNLQEIHERTKIQKMDGSIQYFEDEKWTEISGDSIVSMNMWGFTPGLFRELEARFRQFFNKSEKDLLKAEFFLPEVVDKQISAHKASVRVLPSQERWYGVTYKEDKTVVKEAIAKMVENGTYPKYLWEECNELGKQV